MIHDGFLKSASAAPKLRIGLLVDGRWLPAVFAAMVDQINASSFAEIVLVVRNGEEPEVPEGPTSFLGRALKFLRRPALRKVISYAVYLKLDDKRAYDVARDPLRLVDCTAALSGAEEIVVHPERAGFIHRFPAAALKEIEARNIDVLVRFGFNILKGGILTAARHGVWSYHHGDNDTYRGAPPYFWEMAERSSLCGVVLQILNEELDNGLVLAKAQYALEDELSLFRNRVGPYWASVPLLLWKLKELHEEGFAALKERAVPPAAYRGRRAVYRKPRNHEMAAWLTGTVWRKLLEKLERRTSHWQMALRRTEGAPAINPATGVVNLSGFRFLPAPKGHAYADPFLFEHEGRTFLFAEDYSYAEKRGDIAVMEVIDGVPGPAQICLSTGSHLSYPFVFAHQSEVYMVPESMEAGHVALYRAVEFPHRWQLEKVLHEGRIVDTTVFEQDGTFYFFATFLVPGTTAGALHLFTADSLTDPWRSHPANPISNDVRDARGAGRLIRQDGVLYRPSQDCSGTYGRALRFHRVDVLTPDAYAETLVLEVEPGAVPSFAGVSAGGIHTYNAGGAWEVIDAKFDLPSSSL